MGDLRLEPRFVLSCSPYSLHFPLFDLVAKEKLACRFNARASISHRSCGHWSGRPLLCLVGFRRQFASSDRRLPRCYGHCSSLFFGSLPFLVFGTWHFAQTGFSFGVFDFRYPFPSLDRQPNRILAPAWFGRGCLLAVSGIRYPRVETGDLFSIARVFVARRAGMQWHSFVVGPFYFKPAGGLCAFALSLATSCFGDLRDSAGLAEKRFSDFRYWRTLRQCEPGHD